MFYLSETSENLQKRQFWTLARPDGDGSVHLVFHAVTRCPVEQHLAARNCPSAPANPGVGGTTFR